MMSSSFNSAYQWSPNENDYDNASFQRSNNIYWTLQTRSKAGNQRHQTDNAYQTRDDSAQARQSYAQNVESLYSTPNKAHKNQLKTTPLGFEFYSPVAPSNLNQRIIEEEDENDLKEIMSPIDPRNNGVFSTSTPQRNPSFSVMSPMKSSLTEDLRSRLRLQNPGIRSVGNSPISSGRSTPKCVFEPQQQTRSRHSWSSNNVEVPSSTCSDRLGTPKTSLMDFKKLLLNKNTTARVPGKVSAVELLKMSKSNVQKAPSPTPTSLNSSMNILDLSGSPKTFATRRMIRQGQFGPNLSNSPSKSSKQKQAWRLQNMRTDVISTAIPEAALDEEQESAANANQQRRPIEIKKSPEILIEDVTEVDAENEHERATEAATKAVNLKENLFIKQQENNFTENEIREHKKSAPHNLQQQRAQFLFGVNVPASNAPFPSTINNNNKTAVFKSGGHYTGIVTATPPSKDASMKPNNNNTTTASLETAL